MESVGRTKSEAHAPTWLVGVHPILDWAVPTDGPDLQRSIETHRRPDHLLAFERNALLAAARHGRDGVPGSDEARHDATTDDACGAGYKDLHG